MSIADFEELIMNYSNYDKLNRFQEGFKLRKTTVILPASGAKQLVDPCPQRVYLAFTYLTTATPITFAPYIPVANGDGFPTQGNSQIFEIWLEKHKSLVQQQWGGFNSVAGTVAIQCLEIMYVVREENVVTAQS